MRSTTSPLPQSAHRKSLCRRDGMLHVALVLLGYTLNTSSAAEPASGPTPLPQAHAHNDYYHARPLLDALDCGFCSVEADVFLVDGKLLVAHSRFEVQQEDTLDTLYLKPLAERIRQNGGHVYPDGPPFTLLVDFKNDGKATYHALHQALLPYAAWLTRLEQGKEVAGAVSVIVSGDRPIETIRNDPQRLVGIDGRLTDLESRDPAHLLPLISDNWRNHFEWRGEGPMPDTERQRLREIVGRAHAAGRRVRFMATPESEVLWKELVAADADLINTDELPRLQQFLASVAPHVDGDQQK